MEKWVVYSKRADFKAIGEKFGIDQVTARVLRNRDLIEEDEIRLFLNGGLQDLYDPHLLKDAKKLCSLLLEKIDKQAKIRVIGDYDIDGVMSSFLLKKALLRIGADVDVVIPDRIVDGYGLNQKLIEQAKEDGVDVILTCDNGIAALKEIALAKSLGMMVLVTDHHEIPFTEKDGTRAECESMADAVVNPHQSACAYPNKNLCGAGVVWKVICILYEMKQIPMEEAYDFLENVAFATVGDIMSLTGENRILVKEGIKRIHHTKNIGMKALIAQCGLEESKIDAFHFGFVLGPCINASGRLDTAKRALELFLCSNQREAIAIADELVVLNEERKAMTLRGVEEAKRMCEEEGAKEDSVIVLYLPDVHESVAGIIAGRIREYLHKPAFILTDAAEGIKGSGRSITAYSMYEELCKCQDLLTKFGGHPMAAGLSLKKENVEPLRRRLNEQCTLKSEDFEPKIYIDVPMPMDYVTKELVLELQLLAPFGKDNERPVFADKDLKVSRMWVMGKNKNVLKLSLITAENMPVSGIYYGDIEAFLDYYRNKFGRIEVEHALHGMENNLRLSVIYQPAINSYRGNESLQFEIRSFR